ncbi:MAG: DUF2889 domain-containing protein [Deltaproteobacteria bacterium]|nr:DUF2889 domain-containing protein [Deltaproteobacteria bacterium]
MLIYSRIKSVGAQKQGENRRVVSGVLEDELYAMQCEIAVDWPTLTIESVQTRMKRFTTERCPLASEVFTRAEGWRLDSELDGKIKKELGRMGCRHMAILMVDCCRAVARAELTRELAAALEVDPGLDKKEFVQDFFRRYPELKDYLQLV